MSVVYRTGGIDATRKAAVAHQQQAIDALDILGDNDAVLALRTMASQAVERRG
jgi:geranylgeranyl pyrophosphate synthase